MDNIQLLIFDLGNVIYRCTFDNAFRIWSDKLGIDIEVLKQKLLIDDWYIFHETNNVTIEEYRQHLCEKLGTNIPIDLFIFGWNSIFMEVIEGIDKTLRELKRNYTIVAFSNTNTTHATVMRKKYHDVFALFDDLIFSNEIGLRKPNSEGFWYILNKYGIKPSDALFFDDTYENVVGARKVGINAFQVKDGGSIRNGLRKLGISLEL